MKTIIITIIIALLALSVGCGKSSPPLSAEDQSGFKAAIAEYCTQQRMGMKVDTIDEAKIEGDKATAKCKMKTEGTNLRPTWEFTFSKKDGKWQVSDLKR